MSEREFEELMAKYLAGETTLEEEAHLFTNNTEHQESEPWFSYIQLKRRKAPAHLKSKLLATFDAQKLKRRRFLVNISSLAASIALFVAISIGYTSNEQKSYKEKEALLKEALSMFPAENEPSAKQKIIYEDDLVIIYTESN